LGECQQAIDIVRRDGDVAALRLERRAGIARGNQDFLDARRRGDFPSEGMLSAARSNYENAHGE
jgi:hypothetical protein